MFVVIPHNNITLLCCCFDAGLGVGVALELGKVIVGLDGQFGLVDVEKIGNPKNTNFSIVLGYKF